MTTKVFINGMEVVGSFEDIQKILGIKTTVSARTEVIEAEKTEKVKESKPKDKNPKSNVRVRNSIDKHFDKTNLIQVQDKVVDGGKMDVPNGYIATEYKAEYEEQSKIWRISHSICGSSTYKDKFTGEEKIRKFNSYPKKLANDEIKKLATMPEFKGRLFEFKKPFTDGSGRTFTAWGFKSKELADKALEVLPKMVLKAKSEEVVLEKQPAK